MSRKTQEGWINAYRGKKAYWTHDGNPKRPHALLTSGRHSGGFFNSRHVIPDAELLTEAARDLIGKLNDEGEISLAIIDRVVGPQTGATDLAKLMAAELHRRTLFNCGWASPAKSEGEEPKRMIFNDQDNTVYPNEKVLLCEDVVTTLGSIDLTVRAIEAEGGVVLPYVLVLVNRSGIQESGGRKIISLIDTHLPTWSQDECPLCDAGSRAIRPKGPEEWELLNADYPLLVS